MGPTYAPADQVAETIEALDLGMKQLASDLRLKQITYASIERRVAGACSATALLRSLTRDALASLPRVAEPLRTSMIRLHDISALLQDVCEGLDSARIAWPEAEARLLDACAKAGELERDLARLLGEHPPTN